MAYLDNLALVEPSLEAIVDLKSKIPIDPRIPNFEAFFGYCRNRRKDELVERAANPNLPILKNNTVQQQLAHTLKAFRQTMKLQGVEDWKSPISDNFNQDYPFKEQDLAKVFKSKETRRDWMTEFRRLVRYYEIYHKTLNFPNLSTALIYYLESVGVSLGTKNLKRGGIKQFARKLGISPTTLYYWVSGRSCPVECKGKSLLILDKIEKAVGAPVGLFREIVAKLGLVDSSFRSIKWDPKLVNRFGESALRKVRSRLPHDFPAKSLNEQIEIVNRTYRMFRPQGETGESWVILSRNAYKLKTMTDMLRKETEDYISFQKGELTKHPISGEVLKRPERAGVPIIRRQPTIIKAQNNIAFFLGALINPPDHQKPILRGLGLPLHIVSSILVVIPALIQWYMMWRVQRRYLADILASEEFGRVLNYQPQKCYTRSDDDLLEDVKVQIASETGYLWQRPDLALNLKGFLSAYLEKRLHPNLDLVIPIENIIAIQETIRFYEAYQKALKENDLKEALKCLKEAKVWWQGPKEDAVCPLARREIIALRKEIKSTGKQKRNPFRPIMAIVRAENPMEVYCRPFNRIFKKIEALDRTLVPKKWARLVRDFLVMRIIIEVALRIKNILHLTYKPDGTGKIKLEKLLVEGREKITKIAVQIPAIEFKNTDGQFFKRKEADGTPIDYFRQLSGVIGLEKYLRLYLDEARPILMQQGKSCDAFLISNRGGALSMSGLNNLIRRMTREYWAWNPMTGTGISGDSELKIQPVSEFGAHSARYIAGSSILKFSNFNYQKVAQLLGDSEDMVKKIYCWLDPRDTSRILYDDYTEAFSKVESLHLVDNKRVKDELNLR